jgi:hypothetical protein
MSEYTADRVSGTPLETACPQCGVIDRPVVGPGNGPHPFRAQCRHCDSFIKWVSQYTPAERQARHQQARLQAQEHRPPSARQLAYLQALDDNGPPPATMREASARIDTLVHGGVRV